MRRVIRPLPAFDSNVARPVQRLGQRYPGKHVVERLTVRIFVERIAEQMNRYR